MPIQLKKRKARQRRPDYGYVWLELPKSVIDRIDAHRDRQARTTAPQSRVKWIHDAVLQRLAGK